MEKTLAGKIAFITGSGRGLGRAIAETLAQRGADIVIHGSSDATASRYGEAPSLQAVADGVASHGVRAVAVTGDISDEAAVGRMVQEAEAKLGPVSILVNCAGGDIGAAGNKPLPNNALEISMADVRALIDRNLIGAMLMCRAICPGMAERQSGSVINLGSIMAHQGTSPEVVYGSVKAAVIHYTRCLAFEMRPKGVRVNAVSPGPTTTARFLATRVTDPELMQRGSSLIRYGVPSEVADVVAFLAGDESRFVSGQVLRVDGGMGLFPA
jgi:NAD(P)-dependent dehydrogenase (short-subunit alcohol dehydrogenase family)